jgi:hypothetical protein
MKRTVDDEALWDAELREVTMRTFRMVAGDDRSIDVVEFETWINTGWKALRRAIKEGAEDGAPHDPWKRERNRYRRLRGDPKAPID